MLIPPIGAAGKFGVSAPFSSVVDSNTHYECKAVRRFVDIINLGVDPYAEYYVPNEISEQKYQEDYTAGACIVSLMSSAGVWVYVPTTYITSYPSLGGVSYTAVLLGISLGAIPDFLDLSAVKSKIVDVVKDYIGVTSSVTEVQVSASRNLSYNDHNALEVARQANIAGSKTDYALYLEQKNLVQTLQTQLTQLQEYIKNNLPTT